MSAGNYTVTVTDNNGCTATSSVTITAPTTITASAVVNNNATGCNADGSATVTLAGGSLPYTYLWIPNGNSNANATGLSAGTYTVTVTDNSGCTATASITITAPSPVTASAVVTSNATACANIGSATVTGSGGSTPYSFLWLPGGNTNATASGLSAGNYTVTVSDASGCTGTANVTITAPAKLVANVTATKYNICGGSADTLSASLTGGTLPYTYSWNNGGTNSSTIVYPTSSMTFTVIITDNTGCILIDTVTIAVIPLPLAVVALNKSICLGDTTSIGGNRISGVGYLWAPDTTISSDTLPNPVVKPSVTTTYTLIVTNATGTCANTDSVKVTVNPLPVVDLGMDQRACGTGVLIGNPTLPGYTYAWSPSTGLNNATIAQPLADPSVVTTYILTAMDTATGCSGLGSITITPVDMKFYDGFSPNGDGINDWWNIPMFECYPENTVVILNRYGSEVWKGTNYDNNTVKFEGNSMSGDPLPDGTYYYVIKYSGTEKTGWVFIKR